MNRLQIHSTPLKVANPPPSKVEVGKCTVSAVTLARIINAARTSLQQAQRLEGNMFPQCDKDALKAIDEIDFRNSLWRL